MLNLAHIFASDSLEVYRMVALHHHLVPVPDYDHASLMPKGKRALEFFSDLKVDLIGSGHLHRAYVANSFDVYAGAKRDYGIILSTEKRLRWLTAHGVWAWGIDGSVWQPNSLDSLRH